MPDDMAQPIVSNLRQDGDAVRAAVHGDIDLHNSPQMRLSLLEALHQFSPKRLILDLAGVPYMDSSAVAVLVELLQKMRRSGGRVELSNLQPRVKGLLEIARVDTIFVIITTSVTVVPPRTNVP
jgi:anti-sigma B factor antagonist